MEEDCSPFIAGFFSQLRTCCQRLEASCSTLRASVTHPSASLPPSDSPSLLTTLVDRISSTSQAVRNLESRSTEIVSFQELLGHSMELYKQNEAEIDAIEERLKEYGYTPVSNFSTNGNIEEHGKSCDRFELSLKPASSKKSTFCNVDAILAPLKEAKEPLCMLDHAEGHLGLFPFVDAKDEAQFDSLYSGTLSVQELGLSAAGLACLAEEDSSPNNVYTARSMSFGAECKTEVDNHTSNLSTVEKDEPTDMAVPCDSVPFFMPVDEYDYSSCPTWLKMQISFEDLNEITDRMYGVLSSKKIGSQSILNQEDITALNAGTKTKPFLLLLVKLGRLRTGHENGATVYHIIQD